MTTGPEGSYRATALAPDSYTLQVDAPGLALRDAASVSVGASETRHDLVLVPEPVRERVVVSATRGEAILSSLGVSADVIDRQRIDDRAAASLLPLLQDLAGVATARAGQAGQQGSVFVRGGESRFARVLVDGVAVNQPGGAYDFGTALPFELERVELVRGAASSLYGTDALAGVVAARDATGAAGRDAVAARRGRGRQRRLAALRRRDLRDERSVRLERGRAAPADRQPGAEQRLRGDGRGALRGREARPAHERARRGARRRLERGDARPDGVRSARPRRVVRARRPRDLRLCCAAPRRTSRTS